MLPDDDARKWAYPPHTRAKHAILIRYMKAWLPILGSRSRQLVLVDAFAGRGRYTTDDLGSPLLLRDIAGRVIGDQRVDEVELFYIEKDAANFAALIQELEAADRIAGVIERTRRDEFEPTAPTIIEAIRGTANARPSFWFVDPFGFAGLPLSLINTILNLPRSEVLVTLMVRDVNRFLDEPNHQQADARLFGLRGDQLLEAIERVKATGNRTQALRDLYVERLETSAGGGRPRYVTSVRVAEAGTSDAVYFLVHATGHPLGKREMKEAICVATDGLNAVVGERVAAESVGQRDMFGGEMRETIVDYPRLRALLKERFAGRRIEYDVLQNEAVAGHSLDAFIDSHIKRALEDLRDRREVAVFRRSLPWARALGKGDILQFPAN